MVKNNKKAIVIGASSGIGKALAKVLGQNGYEVGLVARRIELLRQLQKEIPSATYIKRIDVAQAEEAVTLLPELIKEMGGMDLIVLNSGINTCNINLDWEKEMATIDVNVSGFVAMANVAVQHFLAQKSGHIVGISSIACLRGSPNSPSYNASKAFVSNYLQGLRHRFIGKNIYVTDIRPGLVNTPMIRGISNPFWVAQAPEAAEQILRAIRRKEKVAYITRRWVMVAWLIKMMPDWVVCRGYRKDLQGKAK